MSSPIDKLTVSIDSQGRVFTIPDLDELRVGHDNRPIIDAEKALKRMNKFNKIIASVALTLGGMTLLRRWWEKNQQAKEEEILKKAEEIKKKEQQKRESLISYNDLRFSICRGY